MENDIVGAASGMLFVGVLFIVINVVLFLIFREVMCWYWKINTMIGKMDKIIALLSAHASISPSTKQEQPIATDTDDLVLEDGSETDNRSLRGITFQRLVPTSAHGDAFCTGCRNTAPKANMYFNKETDTYYHDECFPKE